MAIVRDTGTFTQTGGTNTASQYLDVGCNPAPTGPTVSAAQASSPRSTSTSAYFGTGTFTQTGGTNTSASQYLLRRTQGAGGSYSLSGTGQLSALPVRRLSLVREPSRRPAGPTWPPSLSSSGTTAAAAAPTTLGGGTLTAGQIRRRGASTFNFNGGLLRAGSGANSNLISGLTNAYVQSGGANIDTNGQNITIAQPLLDGGGGGGLTKFGSGTLTLTGSNAYTGATTVNAGRLILVGDCSSSGFVAQSGGTLQFTSRCQSWLPARCRPMQAGPSSTTTPRSTAATSAARARTPSWPVDPSSFSGVTAYAGTVLQQNGTATLSDFTNPGQVINNAPLAWDGGVNNGGGSLTVNNIVDR